MVKKGGDIIKRLAGLVGLKVKKVIATGGIYQGSSEISYQYVISSNDDSKTNLLAALMADLSFEYQDAVIAANYVTSEEWEKLPDDVKAIEIVFTTPNGITIEEIEKK